MLGARLCQQSRFYTLVFRWRLQNCRILVTVIVEIVLVARLKQKFKLGTKFSLQFGDEQLKFRSLLYHFVCFIAHN